MAIKLWYDDPKMACLNLATGAGREKIKKRYLWLSSMVIEHWYHDPKMACLNLPTGAGREKMKKDIYGSVAW